jgi:hypothetical protein
MYRDVSTIVVTAGASGKGGSWGVRPELLFCRDLAAIRPPRGQTTRHFGRDDKSRKGTGLQTGHYKG